MKATLIVSHLFAAAVAAGATVAAQAPIVRIDGSSTVFPVTEAVAEEFQIQEKGKIRVTVGISGTGGGFKKFARGETDIANASRPISESEMKACKEAGIDYIELPICFDAITVAVHPSNDWVTSITIDELKKIWSPDAQGKVTHWNHVRSDWPNEKIALFGPGADSGTFDYFTEAVCGKSKSSRGDFTASEDDNVLVQGIEGNKYALGYIPYAYYEPHRERMKALAIQWNGNKVKTPVMPDMKNVLAGIYNPMSRPLFIYISKKSAERPEVARFVEFYLREGAALAKEVKYLPLPANAYATGMQRFAKREVGTAYGGVPEVGITVEEILSRKPVSEAKAAADAAAKPVQPGK
jgi:phosphate transport system substrate-binding protein